MKLNKTPRLIVTIYLMLFSLMLSAQSGTGSIRGRLIDEINNEPIPFANIVVRGTTKGTTTDIDGKYFIDRLNPGFIQLDISVVGYRRKVSPEVQIISNRVQNLDIKLEQSVEQIKEVVIEASPFNRPIESPLSMQTIGVAEIERAAGANRDISKVIQSFPGVASTPAFRNDIIIRGGAPNENRFFLDDIEVPNINHFQTQGASGGPVGIINVNLIREVDFQSGAFPASRGNMLSSLLQFKMLDGNSERIKGKAVIGASDLGLTLDGPLGKKTTYILSLRQSYLQFLFSALGLPFLPTYYDYQFKVKHRIDQKNEISLVSIGALDLFKLNTSANETEQQRYILRNIPVNEQWNYAIGATYKHFGENSYQTWVLSRNMLNNASVKYEDNIESPNRKILDFQSQEIENKFRFENTTRAGVWKFTVGVGAEYAKFNNTTFNRLYIPATSFGPARNDTIDFSSTLEVNKYSAFGQLSRRFLDSRLRLSLGLRLDGNDYDVAMQNPFNQFSPRASAAYDLSLKWTVNVAAGRYYQLPPYTIMGYRVNGELVNRTNNLEYIHSDHLNGGFEYRPTDKSKITMEGFYKKYDQYPLSVRTGLSLANSGADFGVVGNEPVVSASEGRAYGIEVLAQQKLAKGFYGILSYTWVKSEFTNADGSFAPSNWDSEHLVSLTAGKKFKNNWEVGGRWRYVHSRPSTPYLFPQSNFRSVYDLNPAGVLDYSRINSERLPAFHQLDLRVDKVFPFEKWSLNLYFDIQNLYNFQSQQLPILYPNENPDGSFVVVNPTAPYEQQQYDMQTIDNPTGTVLPTLGVIIDF
jgi:outer membrane receptor for ferrienterochelin and colicin